MRVRAGVRATTPEFTTVDMGPPIFPYPILIFGRSGMEFRK